MSQRAIDLHSLEASDQTPFTTGVRIALPSKEALGFKMSSWERAVKSIIWHPQALRRGTKSGHIESGKDGTEITSFKMNSELPVRIRCSLYNSEGNGISFVREDVILTKWKTSRSIIAKKVLEPMVGQPLKYTLHPAARDIFENLELFLSAPLREILRRLCCKKYATITAIQKLTKTKNSLRLKTW